MHDELLSRLRKALTAAERSLDPIQLEVALAGVARMLTNNIDHFGPMFAPIVPPVIKIVDDRVESLIAENRQLLTEKHDLLVENEKLKWQLREVAAVRRPSPPPRPSVKPLSRKPWIPRDYQFGIQLFIDGGSWMDVARGLQRSEGEVKGKFINQRPDEKLLAEPIIIHTSGPMSILELWKIGHGLYGEGWRAKIETHFDLPPETILWHTPIEALTEDELRQLRIEWQRSKRAKSEAHDHLYPIFERTARTHVSDGPISWQEVVLQMRKEGTAIANEFGPSFAARFNAEHNVILFKIRESTRADFQSDITQLLPLTAELQAHLNDLDPAPTPHHMSVYEGVLRAGPEGISLRLLDEIGWGRTVGMDLHQMGRAPKDLERQRLIRRNDETLIATYWEDTQNTTAANSSH